MSASDTRYVLEQVFGYIGTALWCVQLLPQLWLNYKRKTTEGLSPYLYCSWILSGLTLGPYVIVQNINIPIMIQPYCYSSLCAVIAAQAVYYDRGWSALNAVLGFVGLYMIGGGVLDVGLYYACRASNPFLIVTGSLSAFFLSVGFFPQLWLIYQTQLVVGVSYAFLAMDSGGAVASIISLALKTGPVDIVALVGYVGVLFFEIVVLLLAAFYNNPAAKRRRLVALDKDAASPPANVQEMAERASDEGTIVEDVEGAKPAGGSNIA